MCFKPLISIIIPIYNSEVYLRKCLDSVLNQTFQDYELILINDGSTDNSGYICDEYKNKDTRIEVIHKKNEGVSIARNFGIKNAKGMYLTFIDSDDWVDNEYLSSFINFLNSCKSDLIIGGIVKDSANISNNLYVVTEMYFKKTEYSLLFDKFNLYKNGYTVAKLYKTELVKDHNIFFNSNICNTEDLLFMLEFIYYSNSVQFVPHYHYHYVNTDNGASLSKKYYSFEKEYIAYREFKKSTLLLHNKFSLSSMNLIDTKENLAQKLFRTIYVLYRPHHRKQKFFRIQFLKKIIQNDELSDLCFLRGKDKLIINRITLSILKKNLIKIADFILFILFKFRYMFERILAFKKTEQ